jgi:hypothetical protein
MIGASEPRELDVVIVLADISRNMRSVLDSQVDAKGRLVRDERHCQRALKYSH